MGEDGRTPGPPRSHTPEDAIGGRDLTSWHTRFGRWLVSVFAALARTVRAHREAPPRHHHSLTAPSSEPEMIRFWKTKNITAIGIVMITAAASLSG